MGWNWIALEVTRRRMQTIGIVPTSGNDAAVDALSSSSSNNNKVGSTATGTTTTTTTTTTRKRPIAPKQKMRFKTMKRMEIANKSSLTIQKITTSV